MFPSCAILEPDRPGAVAEPELKDPPCILHISLTNEAGTYQANTGKLAFEATVRGVYTVAYRQSSD
jgi:hypothetical protein